MTSKNVLITGASSGIGLELAKLFAKDGYNLILVARDKQKLTTVASEIKEKFHITTTIIALDLALPNSAQDLFNQLKETKISVDILVNNAGFAVYGGFNETSLKAEQDLMQVNMVTLTDLTKLFLPHMLAQKSGKILNIASTAGFFSGPLMAVYYASKAYVLHFSEALAEELTNTGVTVTVLCPGPTKTNFEQRAGMAESKLFNDVAMTATNVAKYGYKALMHGKVLAIPGFKNRSMVFFQKFFPRKIVTKIVQSAQGKRN